mgnify:CR=1 FL=1
MSTRATAMRLVTRLATGSPAVRRLSRRLLHGRRSAAYRSACHRTAVDPRVVVFECYAGRGYTCSPRALYQSMLKSEEFSDFEFIWVLRRDDIDLLRAVSVPEGRRDDDLCQAALKRFGEDSISELRQATLVEFGSAAYQETYARAGTWVSNYILPAHLHAREGQRYLQTWHGTPLKRLGCDLSADKRSAMFTVDEIHRRYRREGQRLTWLICPSSFACDRLASAFDIVDERRSSTMICEGYPRNDSLYNRVRGRSDEFRRRLGVPNGNRVLLYAPTFRDDQRTVGVGYTLSNLPDFDLLAEHLKDTHTILFRGHYLLADEFDFERYSGFVIDASRVSEINDLYVISDMLVTDYSSVFFDYANLERPIVFYMHDLERYRSELRGFYLHLDELPGPITHTTTGLLEAIRAEEQPDSWRTDRLRAFRSRFAPLDDGGAAERVIDHLFPARRAQIAQRSGDNPGADVL